MEALELFKEFNPNRSESFEIIKKKIRAVQEKHKGETGYRLLENGNIAIPRMVLKSSKYPLVRRMFGPNKVFVDGGCGLGENLRKAIRDGINPKNAIGINKNPEEIEWGFELYGDKNDPNHSGRYIICDLRRMVLKSSSVDFFHAGSVIHTMGKEEDVLQFLKEVKKVLKPGGIFFGRTLASRKEIKKPSYAISRIALMKRLQDLGFLNIKISQCKKHKIVFRYGSLSSRGEFLERLPFVLHFIAHA